MKKNKLIGLVGLSMMLGLSGCNFLVTPQCVHDWTPWDVIELPTCVEKGLKERSCDKCGKVQKRSIAVDTTESGHHFVADVGSDRVGTCTTPGITGSQICDLCRLKKPGTETALSGHRLTTVDPQPANRHRDPTCTVEGNLVKECVVCHELIDEPIKALGHEESNEAVTIGTSRVKEIKCARAGCNQVMAYELDISDAIGYNTYTDKMNEKTGAKSMSTWDISVLPTGAYDIELEAAMTSASHSSRKLYNMARPEIASQDDISANGTGSTADKASEDLYRYIINVDGVSYNPSATESFGDLGLEAGNNDSNFHYFRFVDGVEISENASALSLKHGNIGYSLYCKSIRLIPHTHDLKSKVVKNGSNNSITYKECECGYRYFELDATQATFANGGAVATTPAGTIAFNTVNQSASYTFDVPENVSGNIYMYGRQKVELVNRSPYNCKWELDGEAIAFADNSKLSQDFLGTAEDSAEEGYTKPGNVLVGDVKLSQAKSHTIKYTCNGDYNIAIEKIVFIGRPAGHIHNFVRNATKDTPASCQGNKVEYYECSECGTKQLKEIPNTQTDHTWEPSLKIDATCTTAGVQQYKCSACSATKNEPIPAHHTWVDQAPAGAKYQLNKCTNGDATEAVWTLTDDMVEDPTSDPEVYQAAPSTAKKTGTASNGDSVNVYKMNEKQGRRVVLDFEYDGVVNKVVKFRIFGTTKAGNASSCQAYSQTIGEGGAVKKFTVNVNGIDVTYADSDLGKTIVDLGLDGSKVSTADDNGALADPAWLDYCDVTLIPGHNTIIFEVPAKSGYSIYVGGLALAY